MKTKMTLREWLPLIGMTISAFLVNTSEFMPIGLLTDISNDYSLFLDCDVIVAAADVVSVQDTAEEIAAWNVKCVCGMSGVVGNFKWLYISCIVTYWCGVCTFHFLGDRITGCSSGCGERASVKGS